MGSCISTDATPVAEAASERAVILILFHTHRDSHAELDFVKFNRRVNVAEVAKEYPKDCFFCSWDNVHVGQSLRELKPWQWLELGEIYFLLPRMKLRFEVTIQEMSSYVFKAASALKSLAFPALSFSPFNDDRHGSYTHEHYLQKQGSCHDRKLGSHPKQDRKRYLTQRIGATECYQSLVKHPQCRSKSQMGSHLETIIEVS